MFKHHSSFSPGMLRLAVIVGLAQLLAFAIYGGAFGSPFGVVEPASTCTTNSPPSNNYTLTFCTVMNATTNLQGAVPVTATLSVTLNSGSQPGVQKIVYTLTNQYLLTNFNAPPSSFSLPTNHFVDGTYNLQAVIYMGDGYTQGTSVSVSFHNGITQPPPVPNTFKAVTGNSPAAGQPFVVAAIGDGAGGEPTASSVTSLIAAQNPNMLLYLGDVYEEGSFAEFTNWYSPSSFFGRFKSITNPVVGNHEYLSTENSGALDTPGYRYYWGIPTSALTYYSFNVASWHVVAMNTNCTDVGGCKVDSPQYNWLSSDLASNPSCLLGVYHEPLYDIGQEGINPPSADDIWSLLAAKHAALVLNGHSHTYQRWKPLDGNGNPSSNGVSEIVAGGGGHSIESFITTDSRVLVKYDVSSPSVVFGALILKLYPTYATFQYINTSGQTLDSGGVQCGGGLRSQPSMPSMFLPLIIR